MSNIIKAAAVTYTNDVRKIDFNDKAEQFTKLFVEKHATVQPLPDEDVSEPETPEDGFKPGLQGIFMEEEDSEGQISDDTDKNKVPSVREQEEELQVRAQQILDEAKENVKQMLAEAEAEAQKIREHAFAEAKEKGYLEGAQKAEAQLLETKKQYEMKLREKEAFYEKQVEKLEPAFVEVIIRLLEKLTGILLEENRDILSYLVEQAVREIPPSRNYLIHVSKEDYETADSAKARIALHVKEGAQVEFVQDSTLQPGQCIVETDSHFFDCGLDMQLKNLILDLRMLAEGLPDTH